MRGLVGLAVLLTTGCVATASEGRLLSEYDRFTGRTVHRVVDAVEPSSSGWGFELDFAATQEDPDPWMTITTYAPSWLFLRCHTVSLIVDGQRFPFLPTEHDGRVIGRGVLEQVRVHLTPPLVSRIARARAVDAQLCHEEFRISAPLRRLVMAFAQRVYSRDPNQLVVEPGPAARPIPPPPPAVQAPPAPPPPPPPAEVAPPVTPDPPVPTPEP